MNLILKLVINYLESHPEQVARLVEAAVEAIIKHLTDTTPDPPK